MRLMTSARDVVPSANVIRQIVEFERPVAQSPGRQGSGDGRLGLFLYFGGPMRWIVRSIDSGIGEGLPVNGLGHFFRNASASDDISSSVSRIRVLPRFSANRSISSGSVGKP